MFKTMILLVMTMTTAACSLAAADRGDSLKPDLEECLVMAGCHQVPQCAGAPECAQVGNAEGQLQDLFSCPVKPACKPSGPERLAVSP